MWFTTCPMWHLHEQEHAPHQGQKIASRKRRLHSTQWLKSNMATLPWPASLYGASAMPEVADRRAMMEVCLPSGVSVVVG